MFEYRWHNSNQQALERESGVLKYWYDEYRNSFEVDEEMLSKTGFNRSDVINFHNENIIKHIFAAVKSDRRHTALRLFNWGKACYPETFKKTKYLKRLKLLIIFMPFSSILLKILFRKKMR